MNLDLLTDGTPDTKPWLSIVADSINTVSSNSKYPATATFPSWNGALAVAPSLVVNAVPAGVGASLVTYSNTRDEVIQSGVTGVTTAGVTTNGSTWTKILTTPMPNPCIMWSPTLNYYSAIDGSGTAVYTSVDGVVYTIGTPFATGFNVTTGYMWSTVFNKFISSSGNAANRICDSSDGKVYTARSSNRIVQGMDESPSLGIVVAVGDQGPQYTEDGKTWINSTQVFSASDVTWSDTFSCFITVPRLGTKRESWRSSDGKTWTVSNVFSGLSDIRTVTWSQDMGLFFAGGDSSYLAFSLDGYTWRRANITTSGDVYGSSYVKPWGQLFFVSISTVTTTNGKKFKLSA